MSPSDFSTRAILDDLESWVQRRIKLSRLVHYDYPPPRSWEQFEELCADLFEVMWADPRLVRHGRAGQSQQGVDIVATRGAVYPVGLQCKKKSKWPVRELTLGEIIGEIEKAEKFDPPLRELYILTTAETDSKLQGSVRALNDARRGRSEFLVEVLSWTEIVRRVARYAVVANKHFPLSSGGSFSPLLATWYTSNGELELTGEEWKLAVLEIGEDLQDWPTGRLVVRQRETDAVLSLLQEADVQAMDSEQRRERIELRRRLRYLQDRERRAYETVHMLYTNDRLKFYMLELDDSGDDAQEILRSLIEFEMDPNLSDVMPCKIRLTPPTPHLLSMPRSDSSMYDSDIPIHLTEPLMQEVLESERTFPIRYYGNSIVKVVSELPITIRRRHAIPAILRRIRRIMEEDHKTLAEMEIAGYLALDSWKYDH